MVGGGCVLLFASSLVLVPGAAGLNQARWLYRQLLPVLDELGDDWVEEHLGPELARRKRSGVDDLDNLERRPREEETVNQEVSKEESEKKDLCDKHWDNPETSDSGMSKTLEEHITDTKSKCGENGIKILPSENEDTRCREKPDKAPGEVYPDQMCSLNDTRNLLDRSGVCLHSSDDREVQPNKCVEDCYLEYTTWANKTTCGDDVAKERCLRYCYWHENKYAHCVCKCARCALHKCGNMDETEERTVGDKPQKRTRLGWCEFYCFNRHLCEDVSADAEGYCVQLVEDCEEQRATKATTAPTK